MFCLYYNLYTYFKNYSNLVFLRLNYNNIYNIKKIDYFFNKSFQSFFLPEKFFSSQNLVKNNYYIYLFKYNKRYYYDHNKYNNIFFLRIQKCINSLFNCGFNILILDSNYKNVSPLYNYIFGFKNLISNKEFFFLNKKNLTRDNWNYTYLKNMKKFKVGLLVILDYYYLKNFLTFLKKFNTPIFSLIPSSINSTYIDYFLFFNYSNLELTKFFMLNYISNSFLKFNFNFLNGKKYLFLKNFMLIKKI